MSTKRNSKNNESMSSLIGEKRKKHETGTPKTQFFMNDVKKGGSKSSKPQSPGIILPKADMFANKIQKIEKYNKNVAILDPEYSIGFKPFGLYLIRYFIKAPKILGNGMMFENTDKIPVPTKNGQGILDTVINPFPFAHRAIIVSIPEHERTLKVGQVVHANSPRVVAPIPGDRSTIIYESCFFKHDSEFSAPTTDMNNPEYGYALVGKDALIGLIKDYDIK